MQLRHLTIFFLFLYLPLVACTASEPETAVLPDVETAVSAPELSTAEAATQAQPPTNTPITTTPTPPNTPTPHPPTPTLTPSPTETPTVTPTPEPVREFIIDEELPAITHDLLYQTEEDALHLWRTDGTIETLAEQVVNFHLAANGRSLVAYIEAERTYRHIDLITGEQTSVVTGDSYTGAALSTDGDWLAFITQSANQPVVQIVPLGGNGEPQTIHTCDVRCFEGLSWHPNGRLVTFTDEAALWGYDLETGETTQLVANKNVWPTENFGDYVFYSSEAWEENGRFLQLTLLYFEGFGRGIFDLETGQVQSLPNSYIYGEDYTNFIHHQPNAAYLSLSTPADKSTGSILRQMRYDPASDELVVEMSQELATTALFAGGEPVQLADGRFAYVLVDHSGGFFESALEGSTDSTYSGIYVLDAFGAEPTFIGSLPIGYYYPTVAWSPDGTAAILTEYHYAFFANTQTGELLDMEQWLGKNVRQMIWLTPTS